MLSALTAVRWCARSSSKLRTRFVLFIDNQSSLAVLVTSRSSSRNVVARKTAAILLCTLKIATLRMRVRETGMPRRRASVAHRGHHATDYVVLNTLSQHRLQSRRQKGCLQQLRVQTRTRCKYKDAVIAFSAWLRDEGQSP